MGPGDDVTGVDTIECLRRCRLRSQLLSGATHESPKPAVDLLEDVGVSARQ